MDKEQLLEKLDRMRAEIASTDPTGLDEESRAKLDKLTDDIQRMLDREELEEAADETDSEAPLSDQANDLVLKFEAEHPRLTSALNQVASALANLGI